MCSVEFRFRWRKVARRPAIPISLARCSRSLWPLFQSFHYMAAEIQPAAQCFALSVAGRPVSFAAILNFPHPRRRDIKRVHRVVTLPDWQGLGLGMILISKLGGGYRQLGYALHLTTRSAFFAGKLDRSVYWSLVGRGTNSKNTKTAHVGTMGAGWVITFAYRGATDAAVAALISERISAGGDHNP